MGQEGIIISPNKKYDCLFVKMPGYFVSVAFKQEYKKGSITRNGSPFFEASYLLNKK